MDAQGEEHAIDRVCPWAGAVVMLGLSLAAGPRTGRNGGAPGATASGGRAAYRLQLPRPADLPLEGAPWAAAFAGPAVVGPRVYVADRVVPDDGRYPRVAGMCWIRSTAANGCCAIDCDTGQLLWKHEYACRYTIAIPPAPGPRPRSGRERSVESPL